MPRSRVRGRQRREVGDAQASSPGHNLSLVAAGTASLVRQGRAPQPMARNRKFTAVMVNDDALQLSLACSETVLLVVLAGAGRVRIGIECGARVCESALLEGEG